MTYISFRGVKVSRMNAQWSFRTSIAALVSLVVALFADRVMHDPIIAFYGFSAAQALVLVAIVVAVPGVVVPLSLLLAPFAIAVYGATHDREVWTTLWFWVLTVVCEVLGGFALVWFGMKYGKREL
jgi:hypothetical protein